MIYVHHIHYMYYEYMTVIAGIERFAFKGVASNLVTYLTDVIKMSNSSAAKMVNSWCGFTSIMPLLVAPFSEAFCHKYSTIMLSSFLYVTVSYTPIPKTFFSYLSNFQNINDGIHGSLLANS